MKLVKEAGLMSRFRGQDVEEYLAAPSAPAADVMDVYGLVLCAPDEHRTLPEPVSGKVGLWSKADSVMYFDDYTVTPATASAGDSSQPPKETTR